MKRAFFTENLRARDCVFFTIIAILLALLLTDRYISPEAIAESAQRAGYETMLVAVEELDPKAHPDKLLCTVIFGSKVLAELEIDKEVFSPGAHAAMMGNILSQQFRRVERMGYKYVADLGSHTRNGAYSTSRIYLFELK